MLKASVGLAALAVAVLVALLARSSGRDPARAVAFVALNPLVLVYGVGGVHNDVFFMALLLGGALLAVQPPRGCWAGALWAAAAAMKLSAGLAIPVLWRARRRRGRAAAGVAIGGAAALARRPGSVPRAPAQRRDAGAARRRALSLPEPRRPRARATAGWTRSCASSSRPRSCWSRSA